MKYEEIARVAHETNRAYCITLGDKSQPSWDEAPGWQKESAMFGVVFKADNPAVSPADMHENWMKQKIDDGWTWGPVKRIEIKEHPCMVPYHELPAEQRMKDKLFSAVVSALLEQEE